MKSTQNESGSLDFSVAGLFRCMLCTHPKSNAEQMQLLQITDQLTELDNKLKQLELKLSGDITVMVSPDEEDQLDSLDIGHEIEEEMELMKLQQNNYLPDWLNDETMKNAKNDTISVNEEHFWIDLIEKYLKPLDRNEDEEKKIKQELLGLRDIAVFAFVMLNALFVLIVFLLQLNKENLHIQWPMNAKNTISYDVGNNEVTITREYLELEPIGLLFVLFFGVILVIQFVAMLVHRWATVSQILATTELEWPCGGNTDGDITAAAELSGKAVTIALRTQRPQPQWDENDMTNEQEQIGRRDTIHRIMYQHRNRVDYSNLETNFKRRWLKDGDLEINMPRMSMSRKTITLLDHRRQSIIQERKQRQSQLVSLGMPGGGFGSGGVSDSAAINFNTTRAVDHTYNTIPWADGTNSSNDSSLTSSRRKPFGSADAGESMMLNTAATVGTDSDGFVNRGFEPSSYDDLLQDGQPERARARTSRVTFS